MSNALVLYWATYTFYAIFKNEYEAFAFNDGDTIQFLSSNFFAKELGKQIFRTMMYHIHFLMQAH